MKPDYDEALSPAGRVIDPQLSEHQAEGMLEGYNRTGARAFLQAYESFLRVVDSMITNTSNGCVSLRHIQHGVNYPALNLIATSTVLQQDHNGYTSPRSRYSDSLGRKSLNISAKAMPADSIASFAVWMKASGVGEDVIN